MRPPAVPATQYLSPCIRPGPVSRTPSPGWLTGSSCTSRIRHDRPCRPRGRTRAKSRIRQGCGDHGPDVCWTSNCRTRSTSSSTSPGVVAADRRGLRSARSGTQRADSADHHHHSAEVPIRAGQGCGTGSRRYASRHRRGALIPVRRQVNAALKGALGSAGQRRATRR